MVSAADGVWQYLATVPTISCSRAVLLLLSLAIAAPARAQTPRGPDFLADAGVAGGRNLSDGAGGSTATATWFAGATVWSAPLRMGRNWTFSTAARLAREPVLAMARVDRDVVPAYFDGIRASGSLWFVHTSGVFDVAIAGRYAETWMSDSQRLTVAANDNGDWTFLFEATAHVRWYATHDAEAPAADRRLMPIVDVYAGVKHDRRYHRTGDLEPYDDPTGRALCGVFVAPWRWRTGDGVPRLVVGGAVDFETALRTGVRLPSAGRALLRVDVDARRVAGAGR